MNTAFSAWLIVAMTLVAPETFLAQAPVPAKLKILKTVFFENQAADLQALDELAKQLRSWGYYQVVDSKDRADLVIALGKANTGTAGVVPVGGIFVAVQGRAWVWSIRRVTAEDMLWNDSEKIGSFSDYGGIKNLVKRLRERVDAK